MVVTPHLVTPRRGPIATPADQFVPPSDFELFLLGEQRRGELSQTDRALISSIPQKVASTALMVTSSIEKRCFDALDSRLDW